MDGVEHLEFRESILTPEDPREDVSGETGTSHPEQQNVPKACRANVFNELLDPGEIPKHRLGSVQPVQPVSDVPRLWTPHGVIVSQDTLNYFLGTERSARSIH